MYPRKQKGKSKLFEGENITLETLVKIHYNEEQMEKEERKEWMDVKECITEKKKNGKRTTEMKKIGCV